MKLKLQKLVFTLLCCHFSLSAIAANDTLINSNTNWKYLDNGSNQGTAWQTNIFNDASWPSGNSEFGYGDVDESTIVSFGPSTANKYITTYFRKSFSVNNALNYNGLLLRLLRDDGAVVYINGLEVTRSNMPTGTITNTTLASSAINNAGETKYNDFVISPAFLVSGTNFIAVEIHQNTVSSNDISFNLQLIASQTCNVPTGLVSNAITTTTATLSWNTNAVVQSYTLQYRVSGTTKWKSKQATVNTLLLAGLTSGTNYQWRVKSTCSLGASNYSSTQSFSTLVNCQPPSQCTAINITATTANLTWTPFANATNYSLQYRKVGAIVWDSIATAATSTPVVGLLQNTNYEWKVSSICSNNSSVSSVLFNFTTLPSCNEPSTLVAEDVLPNSATLRCDSVINAVNYTFQYKQLNAVSFNSIITTTPTINVTGLIPNTDYLFQVRSNCISGYQSNYSSSNIFSTPDVCGTPTGLTNYSIDLTSSDIGWNAVSGAFDYDVEYRKTNTTNWTVFNTPNNYFTLNNLTPNSDYVLRVKANCPWAGNYSIENIFSTSSQCDEVANLTVSNITLDSALLSWDSSTYAASYNVRYKLNDSINWTIVNTTSNNLLLSNLSYASTYQWQVSVNCNYNTASNYTSGNNFITLTPNCISPTNLNFTNVSITSVDLNWNAIPYAISYEIAYRTAGSVNWTYATTSTSNYSLSALAPASVYEWQVRANCIYGNSSSYATGNNFTTLTPSCNNPTNLTYSNVTTTSVTLNWDSVNNANSYIVRYRTLGSTTWNNINSNINSLILTNLAPATVYEWRVNAQCIYGNNSAFVSGNNFTTPTPDCNYPATLTTTNITATTATLNWSASAYVSNYSIRYRMVGETIWNTLNSNSNTYTLNALSPLSNYEWQVSTNCIYGNQSTYTIPVTFVTTAPVTCLTPSGLAVGTVTANTAIASWTAVSGALNYTVSYRKIGFATWTTLTTASTTAQISSLTQSTTFEIQVATNCNGGSSANSTSVSFTTLGSSSADSLINAYSSWKYLDNGSNQGTTWKETIYNDASWATGNAELGYGDGDETTVLSFGPNSSSKYITTYFRKTISVTNPGLYSGLSINLVRDDGAVVYINGIEVMRSNMPTGTITSSTLASTGISGADESAWQTGTAATSALVAGNNVIAVEMHQSDVTSSDISFNFKLAGNQGTLTTLTRSAYIQVVTPTSFRIRWRTSTPTNSQVRYGTTMSYGNVATDNTSTTEHEVLVSGLTANTKYYYTIGSLTQDLKGDTSFYCYTAIATGATTPFRVWATGDFGNNSAGQTNTRDAMNTYCAGNLPRLWVWMGDNAYTSGTDAEFTSNVFNIYPNQMKNIPIYPCLGNHDYAQIGYLSATALGTTAPYFAMFTCPSTAQAGGVASNTEKYYSYNYGNVHFIVLDSYGSLNAVGSPQYNWLQSDLIANTQRFTIVMFHHPPYSHGTHNSDTEVEMVDMRNNFTPLFDQYKVDLVLNGHSHTYERTWLIKGHQGIASTFTNAMKIDATAGLSPYYLKSTASSFDGTVYCVCGVSGQGGSVATLGTWPHNAMVQSSKTLYGSMIIDFNGDTLDAQFVTSTGAVYDRFKIVKSGAARIGNSNLVIGTKGNEVEAFPNPFNEELKVRFMLEQASTVLIEVYDLLGKKVYSSGDKINGNQKEGTYEFTIDQTDLKDAHGMLIIKVYANGKVMQTKADKVH